MDGPVLSGGVIVLVAALLWMLYLLPSWRGRYQYDAAERNAVRLNQALRVLAETSQTPEEVHLELNARTALAQQRLAKRLQVEKEAQELERLRSELAAVRADPNVRRVRARRRMRLAATLVLVGGLIVLGTGVWQLLAVSASVLLWVGGSMVLISAVVLQRLSSVAARTVSRVAVEPQQEAVARVSPPLHDQGKPAWTPRALPEPLTGVTGTRAHSAQAAIDAQEERSRSARLAELRERAEQMAPAEPIAIPVAESPYARMGFVDDAEIEEHVRRLLARRSAG